MEKIIASIICAGLIALIVWWFFKKNKDVAARASKVNGVQKNEIEANGGYSPRVVMLEKGVPAQLTITRTDKSNCLKEIVFSDFGIKRTLPLDEPVEIEIDTSKAGEFNYACGMNMYFGKVVVK